MMKFTKISRKKSQAQAMVEFAIALPVLLLLLYGLIETGRLLFMYSTVVTASRQAVRYGSATGEGTGAVPRYNDCIGMRNAAQRVAYLGPFDSINIAYDDGNGNNRGSCNGNVGNLNLNSNSYRVVVTVSEQFTPIVPRIVPFLTRTISSTSARTILNSVAIVVDNPPVIVAPDETTIVIDTDLPDPSEFGQPVTVLFTVTDIDDPLNPPTGEVIVSGGGQTCTYTLVATDNGIGDCLLTFNVAGTFEIYAEYVGDDEHYGSTSGPESHTVALAQTVTKILSALPSPSVKGDDVVVTVMVTGGSTPPSGAVDVDAGGNRRCTITLSNGLGFCTISFNQAGNYTIRADYTGDSTHDTSWDEVNHQVLNNPLPPTATTTNTPVPPTATITLTPTAGPSPTPSATATATPAPTFTPSPTFTPTAVPICLAGPSGVTHGPLVKSGNSLSMTLTNNYAYPLTIGSGSITWNHDKGHQTGGDKTLKLMTAAFNGTVFWNSGPTGNNTFFLPFTAFLVMPANSTVTISFNFHQSYDNFDGTEVITLQVITNGCNNLVINSRF